MTVRAACHAILVVALCVGGLPSGHAQTQPAPTCNVNAAVPVAVRPEGIGELVGDIVLSCTGASAAPISGTLTVFFNTSVTSRLVSGSTSEALLLVDEPASGSQFLGVNLFQGAVSGNAITFSNVPLYPVSTGQTLRILRLTNLRLNASGLTAPAQLVGSVSVSPPGSLTVNNPVQTVALVSTPLEFSASGAGRCSTATLALTFSESFPAQFKMRGAGQSTPGVVDPSSESGFTPDPAIAGVGLADGGTLLSATISGLAAGAQVSVPPTVSNGTLSVSAVIPAGGGTLSASGGTATLVYEVTADSPAANEVVSIPVAVTGSMAHISVQGSLAPTSSDTLASAAAPIPRFADRSVPATVSIDPCVVTPAPATSLPALAALLVLLLLAAAAGIRASLRARGN